MADKRLSVEIVTPDRIVFDEEIDFIVVPGIEGYLGVLPMQPPLSPAST